MTSQVIVTSAASECVVVEQAIDGIIAVGFGVLQNTLDDVAKLEAGTIFKNELFNQIGGYIIQPRIPPYHITEEA